MYRKPKVLEDEIKQKTVQTEAMVTSSAKR